MDLRLAVLDSNADTAAAGASSPLKPSDIKARQAYEISFDGFAKFAATRRASIDQRKWRLVSSKRR